MECLAAILVVIAVAIAALGVFLMLKAKDEIAVTRLRTQWTLRQWVGFLALLFGAGLVATGFYLFRISGIG